MAPGCRSREPFSRLDCHGRFNVAISGESGGSGAACSACRRWSNGCIGRCRRFNRCRAGGTGNREPSRRRVHGLCPRRPDHPAGSHQTIVLAYVSSCLRETITGPGTVTIGTDRSDVQSAEVRRTRGQCNVGKAIVPDVQGEFGARSFRGPHSHPEGEGEGQYSR